MNSVQATEGKALLLPAEMEMIRATLLAGAGADGLGNPEGFTGNPEQGTTTMVPEELFRKYTETDSRPLTPAPTLASGPLASTRHGQEDSPARCNPRERTTLVLDLRTNSQEVYNQVSSQINNKVKNFKNGSLDFSGERDFELARSDSGASTDTSTRRYFKADSRSASEISRSATAFSDTAATDRPSQRRCEISIQF